MQDPILIKKLEKQGTKYSIRLGQNDGPFLVKDVMLTNQRSLKLLGGTGGGGSVNGIGTGSVAKTTAQSILSSSHTNFVPKTQLFEAPEVYDENTRTYTNYDEKLKTTLSAAENLCAHSTFQAELLKKLQESLQEYKELIKSYKEDLRAMNEGANQINIENLKTIQPMFRDFQHNLKEQLREEKNINYQLMREIEELIREKAQIEQQMAFCERRIIELEKFVGVSAKIALNDSGYE